MNQENKIIFADFYGKFKEAEVKEVLEHISPGWHKLVRELIDQLFKLGWNGQLHQIKEKFGGLRFYIGKGSEEVHNAISVASDLSYITCETCGAEGKVRNDLGWMLTLCDVHHKEKRDIQKAERRKR